MEVDAAIYNKKGGKKETEHSDHEMEIQLAPADVVYFHSHSKSKFIEINDQFSALKSNEPIVLTGEQGYRTAIVSHGISGKDHCSFYLEVEFLPPKTPLPYINVKPGVRVGICNVDIQDIDKPLGSNPISYAYSSTGKMVSNNRVQSMNQPFYIGDTISVLVKRLPNKPDFLKTKGFGGRTNDTSAKTDKYKDGGKFDRSSKRASEFAGPSEQLPNPDLTAEDLGNLETSEGSYIEFFKNGERQSAQYTDIMEADYFFGVSLYMNAKVGINLG